MLTFTFSDSYRGKMERLKGRGFKNHHKLSGGGGGGGGGS